MIIRRRNAEDVAIVSADELESLMETALRALKLVQEILRDPFTGIGKLEPLQYLQSGAWSRRLTEEHRIVYLVSDGRIDFLQGRYHY